MITLYPKHTYTHIKEVDSKLRAHFQKRENLSQQAKRLEKLLQELKKSDSNDPVWSKVKVLVGQYLGHNDPNKGYELFQQGKNLQSWEIGSKFEQEMIALLDTLWDIYLRKPGSTKAKYTENKKHIVNTMYTGDIRGNASISTNFNVDKMIDDFGFLDSDEIKIKDVIKQYENKKSSYYGQWVERIDAREIKTDMYGGNNRSHITLDWKSGRKVKQLLALLNNYKISLKSYKSLTNVGLGGTKTFKTYASVLSALNYNENDIIRSYLRMKCCYICSTKDGCKSQDAHKEHQKHVLSVMHEIKSVYELIGMGLISQNGNFKDNVQLIIINQWSDQETIKVFDTTTLINDYLDGKGMFGFDVYRKDLNTNPFKTEKVSISIG